MSRKDRAKATYITGMILLATGGWYSVDPPINCALLGIFMALASIPNMKE